MSTLLMHAKKLIWTTLGQNSTKYKTIEIDSSIPKLHASEYYINSFPLYFSGQWEGTGQYISATINLDFDQLIQLREKLFIEYGYYFLQCELFRKINKQIYILNEWVLRRMINLDLSNDLNYLNEKKEYLSKKIKENNEHLDQLKFKYVISLTEQNMLLFKTHFYTYPKLYKDALDEINTRIYMYTYHYDKNIGTLPDNYINTPPTLDEFIAGQVKKKDDSQKASSTTIINNTNKFKRFKPVLPLKNLKRRIHIYNYPYDEYIETSPIIATEINNEKSNLTTVQEAPILNNRLTPGKSYKEIHTLITFLATDYEGKKRWLKIQENEIEDFILCLFDFSKTPKLDPKFDISVTGALWACLMHELKIKGYIKGTNKNLSDILSVFFQKSSINKIKKSTFLVYLSDSTRRNNVKEDTKHIPFDIVASFLK